MRYLGFTTRQFHETGFSFDKFEELQFSQSQITLWLLLHTRYVLCVLYRSKILPPKFVVICQIVCLFVGTTTVCR